jgi:hypothetical protein
MFVAVTFLAKPVPKEKERKFGDSPLVYSSGISSHQGCWWKRESILPL